jgi:hypothetical protein
MKKTYWAYWCLIAILLLVAVFSGFDFPNLVTDLVKVFSGDLLRVTLSLTESAILVLNLTLFTVFIGFLAYLFNPKDVSDVEIDLFDKGPKPVYITILIEEIFTKLLFVQFLGWWLFKDGSASLFLFTCGNIIWTLLHVFSYKGPLFKRILRVVPIIFIGFFFYYIFIRYGFWIVLLVHFSYNTILWSIKKKHETKAISAKRFIYWLIILGAMLIVIQVSGTHLSILLPLLNNLVPPPGGIWIAIPLLLAVQAIAGLVSSLLDLDPIVETSLLSDNSLTKVIVAYIIGTFITILMIVVVAWLASLVIENPVTVAILTTAIAILICKPKSGSAFTNLWFFDIPITFIQVFLILVFGFWNGLLILTISGLFSIVPLLLRADKSSI